MVMTVEQMRAQMHACLGTSPIPDASLAQYSTMVAGLSAAIDASAERLLPEDEPAGFAAFLDSFAEGQNDVS